MAIVTPNIKQVSLSDGEHYISAKYLLDNSSGEHTYEDIVALINQGLKIKIDSKHATKEEPATTASASTMGILYLVQLTGQLSGSYTEFITLESTTTPGTYQWEKIGTTDVDLSNYMKRGVTFGQAALNAGAHTHTVSGSVTVPSISKTSSKLSATAVQGEVTTNERTVLGNQTTFSAHVTPTKTNIKATATGTAVGANGTTPVITGITATQKFLERKSIQGVSGSTTASKATAGTAKTFITEAIKSAALGGTTTFNTNAIKSVALSASNTSTDGPQYIQDVTHTAATLTGTKTFVTGYEHFSGGDFTQGVDSFTPNTPTTIDVTKFNGGSAASFTPGSKASYTGHSFSAGTLPSFTQGSKAAWSASVNSSGVLSFSFTTNGSDSWNAGTLPSHSVGTFTPNGDDSFTPNTIASLGTGFYTAGSAASFKQGEDSFTAAALGSASTGTVGIEGGSIEKTTKYMKATGTAANTANVTLSTSAADAKDSITPYTFSDVTVPVAAAAEYYATGKLADTSAAAHEGSQVIFDVTAAGTATALTGVKVTAQPTIALATGATAGTGVVEVMTDASVEVENNGDDDVDAITSISVANPTVTIASGATGDVTVVTEVSVGTTQASLTNGSAASAGAHAHDVKAAAAE